MIIETTSSETWEKIKVDVADELYEVSESVREYFETNMTGLIISDDGKKIAVRHQVKPRFPGEKDTHAYIITIEKIPYE